LQIWTNDETRRLAAWSTPTSYSYSFPLIPSFPRVSCPPFREVGRKNCVSTPTSYSYSFPLRPSFPRVSCPPFREVGRKNCVTQPPANVWWVTRPEKFQPLHNSRMHSLNVSPANRRVQTPDKNLDRETIVGDEDSVVERMSRDRLYDEFEEIDPFSNYFELFWNNWKKLLKINQRVSLIDRTGFWMVMMCSIRNDRQPGHMRSFLTF